MKSQEVIDDIDISPAVDRITKDLRETVKVLTEQEARYLVDYYYAMQDDRKRAANQCRAVEQGADTPGVVDAIGWLQKQSLRMETRVRTFLDIYSAHQPLGQWARSNVGIGPVIAAGLLAHIDISKCQSAGAIWAFAGLDSRTLWKGPVDTAKELRQALGSKPNEVGYEHLLTACQHFRRRPETIEKHASPLTWKSLVTALSRRPWNTPLKTLCWKIGESFVKVSGNPKAFYGKYYVRYRKEEDDRNDKGEYAEQAATKLENFNIGKSTDAYASYSQGRLPKAHIFARAKRRVVKLFLSHYFDVGYRLLHDREPPRPWAIEHGGHTHFIPPPNFPNSQ